MHTELTFYCPSCNQRFGANEELIGRPFDCPTCDMHLRIPSPDALAAHNAPSDVAELLDDDLPFRPIANRRNSATKPVELSLPGQLGSLKAEVDQPTSNAMATTFLGGLLVAVGAVLFSMFGGKHKA